MVLSCFQIEVDDTFIDSKSSKKGGCKITGEALRPLLAEQRGESVGSQKRLLLTMATQIGRLAGEKAGLIVIAANPNLLYVCTLLF